MKLNKKIISILLLVIISFTLIPVSASSNTIASGIGVSSSAESIANNFETDLNLYSPTILLMESQTGKVLYQKNGYEKSYPASTTKIMTAILALEHCPDLSEKAKASYEAIFTVPYDYSNANIQVGEELTINQLLNVLLIASANEAANVLAEHIAGSVDSFATMMNAKASELGCLNTHFVNANGIQAENHYSTAYDLALMARYAMQNETFRKIVSTSIYTLPATNKFETNDRVFGNTNLLIRPNDSDRVDNYYYEYATGVKTGYTNAAKNCVVASAKKNDVEYIAVILGAENTDNGLSARFLDCKTLFEYAFDNYTVKKLHENNSVLKSIRIPGGSLDTANLNVLVEDEILVVSKNTTDLNSIKPEVKIFDDLKAPIAEKTTVGKITYNIDGNEYTSDLIAANDVRESKLLIYIAIIIVLIVLFKLMMPNNKKKKKKKKSSKRNSYLYW